MDNLLILFYILPAITCTGSLCVPFSFPRYNLVVFDLKCQLVGGGLRLIFADFLQFWTRVADQTRLAA